VVLEIKAEMVANVWRVLVEPGQTVSEGDDLAILESMKMEIPVAAPTSGTVRTVAVEPDQVVQEGDLIVELDPS
jgi:biotin carboxyl carrier protein